MVGSISQSLKQECTVAIRLLATAAEMKCVYMIATRVCTRMYMTARFYKLEIVFVANLDGFGIS